MQPEKKQNQDGLDKSMKDTAALYRDTGFNNSTDLIEYYECLGGFETSVDGYSYCVSQSIEFIGCLHRHALSLESILSGRRKLFLAVLPENLVHELANKFQDQFPDLDPKNPRITLWRIFLHLSSPIERPVELLYLDIFDTIFQDLPAVAQLDRSSAGDYAEELSESYVDPDSIDNSREKKNAIKELTSEIKEHKKKITDLTRNLRRADSDEKTAIQDEIDEEEKQMKEKEQNLAVAQGENLNVLAEIIKQKKVLEDLGGKIDNLDKEMSKSQGEDKKTKQKEIDELEKKEKDLKRHIQNLEEDPKIKIKLRADKKYFIRTCSQLLLIISNAFSKIAGDQVKTISQKFVNNVFRATVDSIGPMIDSYRHFIQDMSRVETKPKPKTIKS